MLSARLVKTCEGLFLLGKVDQTKDVIVHLHG